MRTLLPLFAVAVACAPSEPAPFTLVDAGLACVYDEEPEYAYQLDDAGLTADVPLHLTVWFDTCASACDHVTDSSCTASVDATTVSVHASVTVQPGPAGVDCPAVCTEFRADCAIAPLAAGTWTLAYLGRTADLELPSPADTPTPCAGEAIPF